MNHHQTIATLIRRPDFEPRRAEELVGLPNEELAHVDPLVMNLLVAKGIPSLADLEIEPYRVMLDDAAEVLRRELPGADQRFYRNPQQWKNDIRFGRLALMGWYVYDVLGMKYREDQRGIKRIRYTDPSDLFLNGVLGTGRGTCGNMAMVYVALSWRLGWPVSLACVGAHFIGRYDDGEVTHNLEATQNNDDGCFSSPPDEYYLTEYRLPLRAVQCGSDLRAVTPREMLGLFFGLRARHLENIYCFEEAEPDYLLARHLFPQNRYLAVAQHQISVQCYPNLFEPHEKGHPIELAAWLRQLVEGMGYQKQPCASPIPQNKMEENHANHVAVFDTFFAGPGFDADS